MESLLERESITHQQIQVLHVVPNEFCLWCLPKAGILGRVERFLVYTTTQTVNLQTWGFLVA